MIYKIQKTTVFNAPVEKIFETLLSMEYISLIYPSLVKIEKVEPLPNGGNKVWWVYTLAGHDIPGISEEIQVIPGEKIVIRISGNIECILIWSFQQNAHNVWVTVDMEYTLPFNIIGRIAERVAKRLGEQEAENAVMNLMFLVEDLDSLGR